MQESEQRAERRAESLRRRWPQPLAIALAVSSIALLFLVRWLRSFETRTIYTRPPANTDFSPAPFELLTIRDREQQCTAHALFLRAQESKPTFVTFHGNGHQLSTMLPWLRTLARNGLGGFAVEYPGYGLSAGEHPDEENVYRHAEIALDFLRESLGVKPTQVLLVGESLGTGVAVEMASRGHGAKLVLLSPFTSIASAANVHTPWLPARWIVKNRFDSAAKAPAIQIPILVVHGTADPLIPIQMGRQLAGLFPHSKFVALEGVAHGAMIDSHAEEILDYVHRLL